MSTSYKCKKISKGKIEADVIISKDAICFYLVQPETGIVVEDNHDAKGKDISGKVLIMPSGKGSSVVQADGLYKLQKHGKCPVAIIVEHADPVLVSSAIIMEVPMVHKLDEKFFRDIKPEDRIIVDADNGVVTII